MHIPENYLSPETCATMFAVMTPIWYVSVKKVKQQIQENRATMVQLGIGASFAFLVMMFNVPVPGGTTAHAVGSALLAILLGPYAACLSVTMALILQAFLFGDGGILCLGANCFNMAFVISFLGYGIFLLCKKIWKKHGDTIGAFLGGYIAIVVAAFCCGVELGLQPLLFKNAAGDPMYCPYPLWISVPAMVGAHLIIGFIEGGITIAVFSYLKKIAPQTIYGLAKDHVTAESAPAEGQKAWKKVFWWIIGFAVILCPIGLLASGDAWGEWGSDGVLTWLKKYHLKAVLPESFKKGYGYHAAFDGYTIPGMDSGWIQAIGYILCAISAILILVIFSKIVNAIIEANRAKHQQTVTVVNADSGAQTMMPQVSSSQDRAFAESFLAQHENTKDNKEQ